MNVEEDREGSSEAEAACGTSGAFTEGGSRNRLNAEILCEKRNGSSSKTNRSGSKRERIKQIEE
jgi:hypothetical protein